MVTTSPTISYSQNSGTFFPLGTTTVTVTAADEAGNTSTGTFTVTVVDKYIANALFDQTKANQSGSTITIKLQITAADGNNLSSACLPVTAMGIAPIGSDKPTLPSPSPGKSNPGGRFTYDPTIGGTGGYTFNLKTTGLTSGKYKLFFTIGDDPILHFVEFVIR